MEHDPELVRQGKDPQLERAIQEVMAELEKNPVRKPKRPPYPQYGKKPITSSRSDHDQARRREQAADCLHCIRNVRPW